MSDAACEARKVEVNGQPHALRPGCTVAALVEDLGFAGRRVAVAVNREVVPRSHYGHRRLEAGDRIEILQAVGGGT